MLRPIYFDVRWGGDHGIGRFARELQARLPDVHPLSIIGPKLSPFDPLASSFAIANKNDGCYFSPGFNPPLYSPIPVVFTIHDLIHLKIPAESTALRRLYYATVVRPAARRAWRVLTVSEHSKRDIVEWADISEDTVHVVGNGVSSAFIPAQVAEPQHPYLLHVGRRAKHKNIIGLLSAFAACHARHTVRLVFTGDADLSTVACATTLGIADRIDFSGPTSDKALAELYRGATAMVFPSCYEGFGLPIIEAMACGTPVVTSNATSTAEVAGVDNALLVAPEDFTSLAAAIDRLVDNPMLRLHLSRRGLERAKVFNWDNVIHRVLIALSGESGRSSGLAKQC